MEMLCGSLTSLSGENVQIMGHITLETMCGKGEDAKAIDTSYLIMEVITIQVIDIEDDDIQQNSYPGDSRLPRLEVYEVYSLEVILESR